jgi:vacuolar protein sorting-associated protein 72
LKRGEYKWSKLVGAYVGQGTYAARGVPPRFLNKPPPVASSVATAGK